MSGSFVPGFGRSLWLSHVLGAVETSPANGQRGDQCGGKKAKRQALTNSEIEQKTTDMRTLFTGAISFFKYMGCFKRVGRWHMLGKVHSVFIPSGRLA